jgi:hypothetical protein
MERTKKLLAALLDDGEEKGAEESARGAVATGGLR